MTDEDLSSIGRKLESLAPEVKRKILANACINAAEPLLAIDPNLKEFLTSLRTGGELSLQQARRAIALSNKADEDYFALQEHGESFDRCLKPFSLARLYRGIGVAFGAVSGEDAGDAVYELSKTQDDPSELIRSIESDIEVLSR